jgi:UDP-glucose:(heptosyl)LPS alpha-1,3-glucosyltransferase
VHTQSRLKVTLLKDRIGRQGGGLEKYARRLAEAFAAKGHDVTILTMGSANTISLPTCQIVSLGSPNILGVANLWQFDRRCRQWLANTPQDIIFGLERTTHHTHYRAGNGVHAAYLERRKKTDGFLKGLSFAVNPLHRTILNYERTAFEDPDLRVLFTNSHMVKQEVLSYYNIAPEKVSVVHNGVEWQEWAKPFHAWPEQRQHILQALKLDPHHFHLLFVGHGFRRKGLPQLLQGIATLGRRDIHLSIIGKDKETRHFLELAHRLGLTDRVTFFGPREDVIAFYQAADALAIPSTYDPFANVTLEALAMGLFVVSSKDNGGHEVLTPTSGTIIDSVDSPDAIAASLSLALKHPKSLLSAQAIRETAQPYDFASQLNALVATTTG